MTTAPASSSASTETNPEGYTHFAGDPVTEPVGTVIDIDGEEFIVGPSTAHHEGTDTFAFPLVKFDYTRLAQKTT